MKVFLSAKIYGYRVDALHTETQKLSGSIQQKDEEEETSNPNQKQVHILLLIYHQFHFHMNLIFIHINHQICVNGQVESVLIHYMQI
jgi:hypothetical protein